MDHCIEVDNGPFKEVDKGQFKEDDYGPLKEVDRPFESNISCRFD